MKVYIPFNMIIDTDFGAIRLLEKVQGIEEMPKNKLKSFLLKRENLDPFPEYAKLRNLDIASNSFNIIMDEYYNKVINLSTNTDLLPFVLNTYKLGVSNELQITIGCDDECELEFLHSISSKIKYSMESRINDELKLNDFDCIFIKSSDYTYVEEFLINIQQIHAKRVYVADYGFNTLYDEKSKLCIIDPYLHMKLEENGNIVCTVSLYNKKPRGGN